MPIQKKRTNLLLASGFIQDTKVITTPRTIKIRGCIDDIRKTMD